MYFGGLVVNFCEVFVVCGCGEIDVGVVVCV